MNKQSVICYCSANLLKIHDILPSAGIKSGAAVRHSLHTTLPIMWLSGTKPQ